MSAPLKAFVHAACKEIQQASSTEACAQLLRRTATVLQISVDDLQELGSPATEEAAALHRLQAYERLLDQAKDRPAQYQQAFGRSFDYLAEVLLSGA